MGSEWEGIGRQVEQALSAAEAAGGEIRAGAERAAQERMAAARHEAQRIVDDALAKLRASASTRAGELDAARDAIVQRMEPLLSEARRPEDLRRQIGTLIIALAETARVVASLAEGAEPTRASGTTSIPTPAEPVAIAGPEVRPRVSTEPTEELGNDGGSGQGSKLIGWLRRD